MTRIIHAELIRLSRRRNLIAIAIAVVVFAFVAAYSALATAGSGPASRRSGVNIQSLTGAGGGTEAFAFGASFFGFLIFVVTIALVAGDFSSGVFRALALREPRRGRLIIGKLAALTLVLGVALVAAEIATFAASALLAPSQDVSTAGWLSVAGLGDATNDLAIAWLGAVGWVVFGTLLAVVFRSVPLALGVGFAWAGPFENITSQSWGVGYRLFPGQVLASLARGGTIELGFARAVVTALLYAGVAGCTSFFLVTRKDLTS